MCESQNVAQSHIDDLHTPLGRIDNVALKRWGLFTME
jgi:hypothetical protein